MQTIVVHIYSLQVDIGDTFSLAWELCFCFVLFFQMDKMEIQHLFH